MPQLYRIGSYILYFWSNESDPLEPIYVHVAEGQASANATKIWITSTGRAVLCNNQSRIPGRVLHRLVGIISHREELMESIPQQIRVKKTKDGSELTVETGL